MAGAWTMQYELSDGFNYEPTAAESIVGLARGEPIAEEFAYDLKTRRR